MPLDTAILGGTGGVQPPAWKSDVSLAEDAQKLDTIRAQRQQAIENAKDQAAIVAALKTHIGDDGKPDFDGAIKALYPTSPRAAAALQEQWMKMREEDAKQRHAELDNSDITARLLAQAAEGVVQPDGTVDPIRYARFKKHAAGIDPETQQYLPDEPPDPRLIQAFVDSGSSVPETNKLHHEAIDNYLQGKWKTALGQELGAATTQEQADQAFLNARANGAPASEIALYPRELNDANKQLWANLSLNDKDRLDVADKAAGRSLQASQQAQTAKYQAGELAIQQQNANTATARERRESQAGPAGAATGLEITANTDPNAPHGADYLKTLPAQEQQMVKALAEGRQPWPAAFALKTPYWQKLVNEVFQYDPTMDTAAISNNSRQKVRTDFTSGNSAKQINALNTAIGHLDQLKQAAAALHNKNMTAYNSIVNSIMTGFGWTGKTNFDTIAPRVAQEITRVWRGTGGSEADIERDIQNLSSSNAPGQLEGSLASLGGLLESKIDSLKEQYRQGMGTTPEMQMVTPAAQKSLDAIKSGGSSTVVPMVWDPNLKKYVQKKGGD